MVGWLEKEWWSSFARFRYSFLTTCAVTGVYLLATINNGYETSVSYRMSLSSTTNLDQEPINTSKKPEDRFSIYTEGCIIPKLRPFNRGVRKYIQWPRDIPNCPGYKHPLLQFNKSRIWLNKHNFKFYGVTGKKSHVICCYRAFFRPRSVEDIYSFYIDNRIKYDLCQPFRDSIEVVDEFVRVDCYFNKTSLIDVQYFVFAFKKPHKFPSSEERKENVFANSSYSILILGLDAVSRMNFHRTMPKTMSYLRSKDAVELLGYNKVGDNTFPNLVPMLLGISESELRNTCLPFIHQTFDNCPFVWNNFREKNYFTAFGEDSPGPGIFNYLKAGFMSTPTDYYLHPFTYEAQQIAKKKRMNTYLCMGNRYFFNVLLDYVKSVISAVQPSELFGFFWQGTVTHDYLNYPVLLDSSYVKLLEYIDYLNNTIVFLVSDHGMRWGGIRKTKQGRLEERLPFVYILSPQSFKESYNDAYENLKLNVQRLTTPFDIHATLEDLADISSINNSNIKIRSKESYSSKRDISLFLPIPGNRTCHSAGIADHWCTCHSERKISVSDKNVQEAAIYVVSHINSLVIVKRDCAKLTLSKVVEAIEMTASTASDLTPTLGELLVVVQTKPGDGVFEATVHHIINERGFLELSISGTISRLNLYANQSHCIHDSQLKLYCYCE